MADDQLILGHRNAEWTGMGPLLEEDIAFASIAQDKVGHARQLYTLLHDLGESDPDHLAFMRQAYEYRCCHLVELPVGEYDFSLVRHFLFDMAELVRFDALRNSSYTPLAEVAAKYFGEIKYHAMHARTWMKRLGNADETTIERMQVALDMAMPYALGIFEPSPYEDLLIEAKEFVGEQAVKQVWAEKIAEVLATTQLHMPDILILTPEYGGRLGQHTLHLDPLLDEMSEVFRLDPEAEW
jgi:ring-1,2-phenylacetyl-CoA epoxidase subunit PaaC